MLKIYKTLSTNIVNSILYKKKRTALAVRFCLQFILTLLDFEKKLPIIQFTVIENEQQYPIKVMHGSYPNLMFLLKEALGLDSFGECGGVGRCATCVVKAIGIKGNSALKERNEPSTLQKLGHTEDTTRLSCQLYITKD